MRRTCYGIAIALFLVVAGQDGRAQPIYAQFDGIEGEVAQRGYEGWVDVQEFSHGIQIPVDVAGGGGSGVGRPEHFAVWLTKEIDRSSPALVDALNRGARIRTAVVDFLTGDAGTQVWYLRMEMQDVYVTSYEAAAVVGLGRLREVFGLLYAKVTVTYREIDAQGVPQAQYQWGWDVTSGTPLSVEMAAPPEVLVDGGDVLFRWQTTREEGNYGFEIQHREDGTFKRAAYVPGAGWSSRPLEYEVRIRGLEEGLHVFRLAQLRLGGSVAYSDEMVVAVGVPDDRSVVMDAPFPNPVVSSAFVDVAVDGYEDVKISVWDLLGREVSVIHDGHIASGRKARFMFEPGQAGLPTGLYVITASNGDQTVSRAVSVVR